MATEEAGSGNMTEYIQHHLHHLQWSIGDGDFMKINLDTLFFTLVTALVFMLLFVRVARRATAGVPGNLGLLAAIAIDGAPLFQPIAPVLAFDANGEIPLSGTVPPGLGAHSITLRAFAIGANGKLIESSSGTLTLQ